MSKVLSRLICFFRGHKPYRIKWQNVYHISLNRKGGRKKNKYLTHRVKHYEEYCQRCGKLLKKK